MKELVLPNKLRKERKMREQERLSRMHILSDAVGNMREHSKRKVKVQMPPLYDPTVSYAGLKVINLLPGNYLFTYFFFPIVQ